MSKKEMTKEVTFDDLVDSGVNQILRVFGKGEDLRGAVWSIVAGTTNWATEQEKTRTKKKKNG